MKVEIRPARQEEMFDLGAVVAYVYAGAFGDEADNVAAQTNKPEWTLCAFVDGVMASTFSTLPLSMRKKSGMPMAAPVGAPSERLMM